MPIGELWRQLSPGHSMRFESRASAALLFATALLPASAASRPVKLQSETLSTFQRYVQLTESRNDDELRRGSPFLWVDALPEPERAAAYEDFARGGVRLQRLETRDAGQVIVCPGGMIHHWVGAIFLPGAALDDTLALLEDYDHHAAVYAPYVEQSRIESRDGSHFRVFLRLRRSKIITVVLNTENDIVYTRDSSSRAHSRSSAVRIAQVLSPGSPEEREKPVGDDDGFLWKIETWWRMEQRNGGTYLQCESVSLTRNIPLGLAWLIGPLVESIPRESLTSTLEATKRAIGQRMASGGSVPAR